MAFITEGQARAAVGSRAHTEVAKALRASASAPMTSTFDVFLSHSYLDAVLIEGIRQLLVQAGLSVYVDWIEDPQLDRSAVTAATAALLRQRLRRCSSLIFVTSRNSSASKWMPWELGFFDAYRPGHVAILPLVQAAGAAFTGQEYLGLYPYVEDIPFRGAPRGLGIFATDRTSATPIRLFASSGHT